MKFARKATTAVGLALTLGLSGLAPVGPVAYAAEDAVVHDGSSSDKAAASCYEAKQVNKDAKSGKYWLYTLRCRLHSSSTATRRLTAAVGF
ncbi:Uncharacterised protein [Rothia dentocariosa]|uniref:Uncharacterized protein n=1 Tax=Rothia dentocariosa TaxID=2047 RepID=A0A448USP2_9MICC|nr:Uncharacterised protein [Rothia dentocariosa]